MNNIEMKNELINTIRNILENNSILKNKIIANKESKIRQFKDDTFPSFFMSLLSYITGIFMFLICLFEPTMRHPILMLAALSICLLGWMIRLANKLFTNTLQNTNVIDLSDYYILYDAGNTKQKNIIDLLKQVDYQIKYKEIFL